MAFRTLNITVDEETYLHADALFRSQGTDVDTAVRDLLYHASYDEMPEFFHVEPNEETAASLLESVREIEDMISGKIPMKAYKSVEEMNAALDAEDDQDEI